MKNRPRKLMKLGVIVSVVFLVVSSATAMENTQKKKPLFSIKKTIASAEHSRDETELKYYFEENLDQVIGACGSGWKSAIRLTQDEMAAYMDWTLTKVNVAFHAYEGISYVDARIYIFDKGDATHPGPLIVNDTAFHLSTTGVHTLPLVTPVNLSGHEELWIAVEWTKIDPGPGVYFAWIDTLTGPHVPNKSDFVWLGNSWSQLHFSLPECDGRWGIGAIVEGEGATELAIGNIIGPMGIQADVQNVGGDDAINVQWSITVTGDGLRRKINITETGTSPMLNIEASLPVNTGMFFGFAWIDIEIRANAQNANQVSVAKSAFLLGPFVLKIKDTFPSK